MDFLQRDLDVQPVSASPRAFPGAVVPMFCREASAHWQGSPEHLTAGASRPSALARMVGQSEPMRRAFAHIQCVAPTDTTITIVGESGTGKELAARAIHDLSTRSRGAFVPVNCGAIPATLAEAEFFGFEKGAFTGAHRRHIGYFERARGGTLFLDEIAEMPLDLQVKLLRALETGQIMRVGGASDVAVDVRVVSATNRDPMQAVIDGRLREDLYYRLAVFVLRLPPLRERGEDATLIAQLFLDELNVRYGTEKEFGAAALAMLRNAQWPGNVRELRNYVERGFILAEREIALDHPQSACQGIARLGPDGCIRFALGSAMADVEREMILATIEHCGSKRKAAAVLGLSLKTIYNKLAEYGVGKDNLHLASVG